MKKRNDRVAKLNVQAVIAGLLSLFLLTAVQFANATDKEDVKEEVSGAIEAMKDYSVEQKDMAVSKARKLMDDIDDKIHVWEGKMEAHWDDLKDSSREEYSKSKSNINKMRNNLSEWYGGMKHSSKEAWSEAKEGFLKTYEDVANALKDQDKQ